MVKFMVWFESEQGVKSRESPDEKCHSILVRLLLAEGADPNEVCHGLTPWSIVLHRICSGHDDDFPLRQVDAPDVFTQRKQSFLDKLEVAKLMLDHGADPFYTMETQRYSISPKIFADMLERECCGGYALNHCSCAYAREIKPRLTELVDLVEERKYLKQQMRTDGELLLTGVWLVVVSAYILQISFT
jgi:hypothetical protein